MNTIRPARPEDFAAVRALLTDSALVYQDLTPKELSTFVVIPAEGDLSTLAAVAGLEAFPESKEGLLRSVAVVPALRGQGIGMILVADIERLARAAGLHRLWLLTTTAPDFFRRLGYEDSPRAQAPAAVQQSSEFQSLCPASAVCLSKSL